MLSRHKRGEDFLARIGGEEFVLLLPMAALTAAKVVADKLRLAVENAAFRHSSADERIEFPVRNRSTSTSLCALL